MNYSQQSAERRFLHTNQTARISNMQLLPDDEWKILALSAVLFFGAGLCVFVNPFSVLPVFSFVYRIVCDVR